MPRSRAAGVRFRHRGRLAPSLPAVAATTSAGTPSGYRRRVRLETCPPALYAPSAARVRSTIRRRSSAATATRMSRVSSLAVSLSRATNGTRATFSAECATVDRRSRSSLAITSVEPVRPHGPAP